MLDSELSKDTVLHAAEQVKEYLSPNEEEHRALMKKGMILYRQGSVFNVRTSPSLVRAKVQDVTPVSCELDLEFFLASTCSCPNPGLCRHLLALFLYVYASYERVGTFLDSWNSGRSTQILAQFQRAKRTEIDDASLDSWYAFFEEEYKDYRDGKSLQTAAGHYEVFFDRLKRKAPQKVEIKRFFIIHAAVYTVLTILDLLAEKEKMHQNEYLAEAYISELEKRILTELGEMKRYAMPFALDPLLDESVERFRELLFHSKELQFERFSLYRHLWNGLLNREKYISRERADLEERLAKLDDFASECKLGLAHLDYLQRKDEALETFLEEAGPDLFPFTFDWMGDLTARKQWKSLSKWLDYVYSNAGEFFAASMPFNEKRRASSFLLTIFQEYSVQTKDEAAYEKGCQVMLPYSFSEYAHFLAFRKQFKSWAELHLLIGFSVEDMDKEMLRAAEKEAPESLLPIYHRYVWMEISQRNRQSYKHAVRKMKKIKKIYEKLKAKEEWEDYLAAMLQEHKRLRAFREELVKGKLIHA
ncbi:SWIM zinc finger family protein [Metabacillus sp. GX 13764]|uniref:SWIM zinc finger family protein n=1 Tax=Metabacillus kandeliae TaxID=2900151 RepID=UPI001E4B1630|nr:SWIM zinc finger family protein [Metabacillus kandeliae]MCD7034596.1 SWIM zinc finger family protein [Metabacillus kandeliae]